jgi:hypothetical protein
MRAPIRVYAIFPLILSARTVAAFTRRIIAAFSFVQQLWDRTRLFFVAVPVCHLVAERRGKANLRVGSARNAVNPISNA